MGTITSGIGLISGINSGQIIDELMTLESQPVTLLQSRIKSTDAQQTAFGDLSTQLQLLQATGTSLSKASTFQAATTTSSNPSVLTATAANGAAIGSYNLQVAQLVSTQQMVSQGFTDFNQSPVGAGTISIEMGGGGLASKTTLAQLNGGAGIPAGQFRITDRSGGTAVIDTSSAISVDDVLQQINTSLGISVRATVKDNQLILTDTSGKTTSNLSVQDLGNGSAASALGIAGSVATSSLTGVVVNYLTPNTQLTQLNDNRGIRVGSGGNDFTIQLGDGTQVGVNLAAAKSVGDVLNAINTAGGNKLKADLVPGANGIRLTDSSGGGGGLTITQQNGSNAAKDLGLLSAPAGNVVNGSAIIAGIDTTLLTTLRGGSGLSLGSVNFTDRAGHTQTINFAGATTVQNILDDINSATGVKLKASLKSSGNGIQITDTSGGGGDLVIADNGGGQTAAQLGIAGTFTATTIAAQSADLHRQWVTNSTSLASLNGGKGIAKGKISITNAAGASASIDLSGTGITTVASVLSQINNAGIAGVTASINSNGNGILISDSSGGAGKLTIADVSSTAAADLNIAGTAAATSIDGAYQKTLTVGPNDSLATVQQAINALGWGVSAQIINDGSATSPYRLSLTAQNSGTAGAIVFDDSSTKLGSYNLVRAQDAAVFLGNSNSAQPLLITSSSNQISGVIQGVTLNLTGVSSGPVQLNVTDDSSGIVKQLTDFTTNFNTLVTAMDQLTSYNSTTNTAGLLLGDATVQQIQSNIYNMLNTVVPGGSLKTLASVGITVGDKGALQFDPNVFQAAFAQNPAGVQQLFTATQTVNNADGTTSTQKTGVGFAIANQINALIDPVNGTITQESQSLGLESKNFQDQITELNAILANKRQVLEEQFSNMETVLAGLQSQQSALSSLTGITASTSSSKSSSSGSSSSGK